MAPRRVAALVVVLCVARADLLSCSEYDDATTCVDHTTLGVHSCEWCATESACHDVDSLVETCTDACCASKSDLSVCDFALPGDIDAEECANSPGAVTCDDIESADGCYEHTRFEVHTCEWCASEGACHDVDSPYDTCARACCASQSVLSRCADSLDAIDADACDASFELNATVWRFPGMDYAWPEAAIPSVAAKPRTGLGFSGGGSRAYAAAVSRGAAAHPTYLQYGDHPPREEHA